MKHIIKYLFLLLLSPFLGTSQTYTLSGTVDYPITGTCYVGSRCCTPESSYDLVENIEIDIENLDDSSTANDDTDSNGEFSVSLTEGLIKIIPTAYTNGAPSDWTNGVSTLDLAIYRKHIDRVDPLNCPFRRISGDVENDGDLDTFDINVTRDLILGITDSLADVPNWRFVAKPYVLPNGNHPSPGFTSDFWNYDYEDFQGNEYPFNASMKLNGSIYTYNGSSSWMEILDEWMFNSNVPCGVDTWGFYIFKSGDATGNANRSSFLTPPPLAPPPVNGLVSQYATDVEFVSTVVDGGAASVETSSTLPPNKKFRFTLKASSPVPLEAYQMGIYIDPEFLELKKVKLDNGLSNIVEERDFNLNADQVEQGLIRTLWINDFSIHPEGFPIIEPTTLFSLIIKTRQNVPFEELLNYFQFSNSVLSNEFYANSDILENVELSIEIEESNEPDDVDNE